MNFIEKDVLCREEVIVPLFFWKGDVPTRMGYGNEYECFFLSVQIVVGQGPGKLHKCISK